MRPTGSAEAVEARRMMAGRLLLEGRGVREVSRLTVAVPSSVSLWKQDLEQGGLEALKAKPHPGRSPRLARKQSQELEEVLLRGARAAGSRTHFWTLARVTDVIEREFGT